MGKPAARIGDMHVCPMITPGTPPVPHVGGPVTGPGAPTVLICGMPAALLGDMCVCTGPPDTIILGSTGVFIGGKPAARMGDQCAHGGTIVIGAPTVLIGESGGGGGSGGSPVSPVTVVMQAMQHLSGVQVQTPSGTRSLAAGMIGKAAQIQAMQGAAETGTPFCEPCAAAAKTS